MTKTFRKIIYIIASFLIVLMIGAIWGASYVKPILKDEIQKAVEKSGKGLYRISYKDLKINLLTGSAKLSGIRVHYDSVVYKKRKLIDTIPQLFQLDIPLLRIKGLHVFKLIRNKKLVINHIEIIRPKIQAWKKSGLKKQNEGNIHLKNLESIFLKKIDIRNGEFIYYPLAQNSVSISDFSLKIRDVLIDSNSIKNKENMFLTNNIEADFNRITFIEKNHFYTLYIERLMASLKNRNIEISGLNYTPNYNKNTFAKKRKKQDDRLDLRSKSIQISDIDFEQIFKGEIYAARKIRLDNMSLEIHRDARIPRDWSDLKEFPFESFFKMKTAIKVDSIEIKNSSISVIQVPENGLKAGNVSFNKLNGNLTKIDNQQKTFVVKASCRFINNAPLSISINGYQKNGINHINTEGILSDFKLTELNSISNAMANVHIEDGSLHKLYYNFYSNGKNSSGNVRFLYEDLEIKILNNEDHSSSLKEKVFTKLSNNFILNSENSANENEKKGRINFTRDPHFSFYNYYWKSIFSGIKEIVVKENPITDNLKEKEKAKQKETRKRRK